MTREYPQSMNGTEWASAFQKWEDDTISLYGPEEYFKGVAEWFEAAIAFSWSVMSGG